MTERRRIFVAVEPRLLGDALVALLEFVGVDDVVSAPNDRLDRSTMGPFDAAVVSSVPDWLDTEVLIEVPGDESSRSRNGGALHCATPEELLVLLDRHCPAAIERAGRILPDGPVRTGEAL